MTGEPELERFKRIPAVRASFQEMSRTATFDADVEAYPPFDWALLPPPGEGDTAGLALETAQRYAYMAQRLGGLPAAETAKAMLDIREQLYINWPGHYVWFYLGAPRRQPLPVMMGVWRMTGERDQQLRTLAGAETEDLVEPPIVESFTTERLGTGVKVTCVQKGQKGKWGRDPVVGLLGYAWRSQELETDLHLRALCPDLGWLQGATPDIDAFTRALRIVPKRP